MRSHYCKRGKREWTFLFYFLNSSSIPVGIRMDRPAGLSTTQVIKGSLLLESGKDEKEKQRESFVTTSSGMN